MYLSVVGFGLEEKQPQYLRISVGEEIQISNQQALVKY